MEEVIGSISIRSTNKPIYINGLAFSLPDLAWTQEHTRLLIRAREWERISSDNSFLLRGKDLRGAEEWMAKSDEREPKPTALQAQYILASR